MTENPLTADFIRARPIQIDTAGAFRNRLTAQYAWGLIRLPVQS